MGALTLHNIRMTSKPKLLARIVGELLASQRTDEVAAPLKTQLPFEMPPQLPIGDGRWLPFSKVGLGDNENYAKVLIANNNWLAQSFSRTEVTAIVARAFGASFAPVDIDAKQEEIEARVAEGVRAELDDAFGSSPTMRELSLGCWALTGNGSEDLSIGPIRITERNLWLERLEASGRVDRDTSSQLYLGETNSRLNR